MGILGLGGFIRVLVAAAIALVPAAYVYVRGRQFARFADDPALPERLFAGRRTTSTCFIITFAALYILTGRAVVWGIPLSLVAYAAAALPLRRILYNETWSLPFYLSFVIRFFVAMWSFWALVCALPALALWTGDRGWIVALALGAALFLILERQADVIRWLIQVRPLADQAMRARFDRLVAACGLATPHFDVIDVKGGSIANAFALASLGGSAVIFTGPLLQQLGADEVDAICAHELAHLEYHNVRRLRRRRLVSRSLLVGAVVLTHLLQAVLPSASWLACAAWPAVVVTSMAMLARDRQKHETASDLRAVALTGNPEALVRGLVKIHAIAHVPRRWDADLERHMSHPSLKKRIQDIRAAAGTPPAALGDAAVFEGADGKARVVFADEGLEWIEGTAASYRVRYDRLGELRVAVTSTGGTSLVAADRTGHRWHMGLRADDVPRMQAVLDIVDARVETFTPARSVQPMLVRAATLVVFVLSLNLGQIAAAMVLALTLAKPEAPLVGAAGVAAIAGAALTWRDPGAIYGFTLEGYATAFAAILVVAGAALVWLAWAQRRAEVPSRVWALVALVAAGAVASWVLPLMGSEIDAVGLHQAARQWSAAVVLPLAVAGAMMWASWKSLRAASAVAVAASVVAAGVGSQAFLDRFGGDLFLVPAPDVKVRTLDTPIKEFTIPLGVSALQLSPGGRSIAAITRGRDRRPSILIGRAGETLTPIAADGALFLDDDRVLVWSVDGTRTDLRVVSVSTPEAATWELRVTGLQMPAVSLDAKTQRWRLARQADLGVVEGREGVIGSSEIRSYRWSVPARSAAPFMPIAVAGDRALALEPRPDLASTPIDPLGALVFVLASGPHWRSTIWALGPDGPRDLGTSRLELECHMLPLADRGACHIFDASRTRFFAMDAATATMSAVASLPGRFYVGDDPQGAWITGWYQEGPIAVRVGPADAIRAADRGGARAHILAVSDRAAAAVWFQRPPVSGLVVEPIYEASGTSIVRIYSIE